LAATVRIMPYVACPECLGLTYVVRSFLHRGERCPVCDTPLDPRAILAPAHPRRAPDKDLFLSPGTYPRRGE